MFYRDEVNRKNPNRHKGMIYCSNLCTEIAQNLSPTSTYGRIRNREMAMLSSYAKAATLLFVTFLPLILPRAVSEHVLERLIPIQVRMLDNVIDVNNLPVKQAKFRIKRYRAIGLGTFGWLIYLPKEYLLGIRRSCSTMLMLYMKKLLT